MKKMKLGIISILMILALLVMATGCDESNGETSSAATEPSDASETISSAETSYEEETTSTEENSDTPNEDAKTILGMWNTSWDMSDLFNMAISMGDETVGEFVHVEKLEFLMQFTFREDGTCAIALDEEALQSTMAGMAEDLKEGFNSYIEYMIEANQLGVTVEEFLAASGIESMDEYIQAMIGGFDEISESFETTSNWRIEDGKLYVTEKIDESEVVSYYAYELTENELKLLELHTEEEDGDMAGMFGDLLGDLFPMVLTRAE